MRNPGNQRILSVWQVLHKAGLVVWWRHEDFEAKSWWTRLLVCLCLYMVCPLHWTFCQMEFGIPSSRKDWDWTIRYQQHLSNLPWNSTCGGIDTMRTCGVPTVPRISTVPAVPHVPYASDRSNTWVVHVIKFGQSFGDCGMASTATALSGKFSADRLTCFLLAVLVDCLSTTTPWCLALALQFLLSHGCGLESMGLGTGMFTRICHDSWCPILMPISGQTDEHRKKKSVPVTSSAFDVVPVRCPRFRMYRLSCRWHQSLGSSVLAADFCDPSVEKFFIFYIAYHMELLT